MTLTDEFFNTSIEEEPKFTKIKARKIFDGSSYKIYPISQLKELLIDMNAKPYKERSVRVLVDTDKQVWFAEEGPANASIPAHFQMIASNVMNPSCITAGNIEFSEDFDKILWIKNKSGDFSPSFDSLKWLLAILVANKELLPLSQNIGLIELDTPKGVIPIEELSHWLKNVFGSKMEDFKTQPTSIKHITYGRPTAVNRHSFHVADTGSTSSATFSVPNLHTPFPSSVDATPSTASTAKRRLLFTFEEDSGPEKGDSSKGLLSPSELKRKGSGNG